MGDVEAPLARVIFQDNNNVSPVQARPNISHSRNPTARSISTPNTPDKERGTDPLSAHIFARTQSSAEVNTESPSFRRGLSELVSATLKEKPRETPIESAQVYEHDRKERKKRVSFFAKLRGKDIVHDENLETTDELSRSEGAHASTYCTNFKTEKPTYIRVRASNKPNREFNNLFLAQELCDESNEPESVSASTDSKANAIWAMKFSKDGRYLATGGQDMIVRVWRVLSSPSDRMRDDRGEAAVDAMLNAPVFCEKPHRVYHGHTADILDLSWSKNNFLLSSSMDKTVRLWHVSREECLCCFQHSDFVTSIAFHPKDDRFFISGSLDCKLRLWNIPEKQVANWNELPELITAVAFDPSGRMAIAGSFTGLCLFYETDGLRYHTQIHVRSTRGRNAQGSKITGIQAVSLHPDNPHSEVKLLITSNDSRIRLYNMRDKSLETKFKGNDNKNSQIRASFSDDLSYVICGSEDREVYIWSAKGLHGAKEKKPFEHFEAHTNMVTATTFAPNNAREHLANSGDPIYDAVSLHQSKFSVPNQSTSSTENGADYATSTSSNGNIIICADYSGRIKVFRQDSAMSLRNKLDDRSEVASIASRGLSRRQSSSRSSASTSPRKTSPSIASQESSAIVRKPHESIIPTSPARARTSTTQSSSTNDSRRSAPSIQVNGNPVKGRVGQSTTLSKTSTTTTDPTHLSTLRKGQENGHGHLDVKGRSSGRQVSGQSTRGRNESQNRNPRGKSRSRSRVPAHERDRNTEPHSQAHQHHKPLENPRVEATDDDPGNLKPESNPYLGEGGISFGFYDVEPDATRAHLQHDQRPSNARMQTTDSWAEMDSHQAIRCEACGSDSFAVTQVRGAMRLTCQTCHIIMDHS